MNFLRPKKLKLHLKIVEIQENMKNLIICINNLKELTKYNKCSRQVNDQVHLNL